MEAKTVERKREQWSSQLDFILSCLGYAVGLGNLWRFPYICGRNGGAAFLIPYLIFMVFAGLPGFYLELALGQYGRCTPLLVYRRLSPIFTGFGYTVIAGSIYVGTYYNIIIAWSLYYLGASFKGLPFVDGHLPWRFCNNTWNNPYCYDDQIARQCISSNSIYYSGRCVNGTDAAKMAHSNNVTVLQFSQLVTRSQQLLRETPAQQYNKHFVLNEGSGFGDIGWPKLDLVLVLFIAWILVFFCLIKGIKSSGKVVYLTATLPYVLLLILLVRGNMLEGASDGLLFFVKPNWTKLTEGGVWVDAAHQIFFSLSLGGSGLVTLASYNHFHNNIFRDTLIVVLGNCGTSILAGFTIFPIIGYVAKQLHPDADPLQRVARLASGGTTLAFVAYPDAIDRLPAPWLWAILFFFMLILLGIDSQMVIVEVLITAVADRWPGVRRARAAVVISTCVCLFFAGLILTTPIATFVVTLLDKFAGGITLIIGGIVINCMVAHVYGYKRFVTDIQRMLGKAPNKFWKYLGYPVNYYWIVCWAFISPLSLTSVFVMYFVTYERTSHGDYVFPVWAEVLGWTVTASCLIWLPLFAQYRLCKSANLTALIHPTAPTNRQLDSGRKGANQQVEIVDEESGGHYAGATRPVLASRTVITDSICV